MKKMDLAERIVRQSTPILLASMVFCLVAGKTLEGAKDFLVQYPVLLLVLPAYVNLTNLALVLGSKLSSYYYVGVLDKDFRPYRLLAGNVLAVWIAYLACYFFVATVSVSLHLFLYKSALEPLLLFAAVFVPGVFTGTVLLPISVLAVYLSLKKGLDPDTTTSPVIVTLGDTIGTLSLVFISTMILV